MKQVKLSIFWCALFLLHAHFLIAQTLSPDWAKQINGTKGGGGYSEVVSDKQGNAYALYHQTGFVNAGGQTTPDSTVTTVLTSWDCNGNLRWMKSLGGTANSAASNNGIYLEADTLGGIYVSGQCTSPVSATVYWDTDTAMNIAAGNRIVYLLKYNTQGQFQWLRTPVHNSKPIFYNELSVSPSGEVFWFALLDTGTYNGGAFIINTRKYYAVRYNAAGSYQSAIPLDLTPPALSAPGGTFYWKFALAVNRFYGWVSYGASYGNLVVGSTTIAAPTGSGFGTTVLAAFDKQGQNLWVRQASTAKYSYIDDIASGKDGTLYVRGSSEPGTVFCGDTATNALGQNPAAFLMALDSNAGFLWSNHSANTHFLGNYIYDISLENNVIVAIGKYYGTLSWGNQTLTNTGQNYNAYMLKANAATGAAQQLVDFTASILCTPTGTALDKNGNVYISGEFQGSLSFGSNSLSSIPSWSQNHFLLKYKNVSCGCNLLQPAFNINSIAANTYQCTYTGGTPYTAISWSFGDGTLAVSGANPSHTYTSFGTFPVCVTVTDTCGSNTTCKYLTVIITNIADAGSIYSSVNVYPNPAKDELMISDLPRGTTVELSDVLGRSLKKAQSDNGALHINIKDLSAGIHLLRFTDKEGRRGSRMFVKQ